MKFTSHINLDANAERDLERLRDAFGAVSASALVRAGLRLAADLADDPRTDAAVKKSLARPARGSARSSR